MFRLFTALFSSGVYICNIQAQTDSMPENIDSLLSYQLEETIIIEKKSISDKTERPLATLDQYLEKSGAINMIRRGGYAWEPYINGMGTERSVITVDGMRIYGACTDKMDPVTSYVEITNLSKANIQHGQSGSTGGSTIAGTLDLTRKKSTYGTKSLSGTAFTGFETNNLQKIMGTGISFSHPKAFTDINFTYRDAENYKAGGKKEILYSQFTKYNMSAIAGYRISAHQELEVSLIYDHAKDVGYPALPMDVSTAKAFIGSVEYIQHHITDKLDRWETKIYYNDVTHIMDDTKRPVVPIRMDMPGWSKTAGFYSLLEGKKSRHFWKANLSGHHNQSLAEMTMFSNNPGEKDMFMLTWPGVHTNYADAFAEDIFKISDRLKLTFNAGLAVHNNIVKDEFGFNSLKIFYPDMQRSKTRFLKRLSTNLQYQKDNWYYTAGVAYGERAPGVSEGYGFYLFNSFDRFDYIGNPEMKNEKSVSATGSVMFYKGKFNTKLSGSYFYLLDYIIGRPDVSLSVMTIGASGVKIYEQVPYAHIVNTSLDINYELISNLTWTARLSYRNGNGSNIGNLPLTQPFSYNSGISYQNKICDIDISIQGAARHKKINPAFGESELAAYTILNVFLDRKFLLNDNTLRLRAGADNLLDKKYSTFADWNRIPRMGRNFYFNLIWSF